MSPEDLAEVWGQIEAHDELERQGREVASDDHDSLETAEALVERGLELHAKAARGLLADRGPESLGPSVNRLDLGPRRPERDLDSSRRLHTLAERDRVFDEGFVESERVPWTERLCEPRLDRASNRGPHEDRELP